MAKLKHPDTTTNNERIARAIILSNTNDTQRNSLLWLSNIERAIVEQLDRKDHSAIVAR